MLMRRSAQRGMSLIELMVGIAIIGILLALAAPSFRSWTQNTKIRGTAEAILNGLQLAKAEAVRRNTLIRFQATSDLTNGCTLGAAANVVSYANWVVSFDDPATGANRCASAPIGDGDPYDLVTNPVPRIIRTKSAGEGSNKVVVIAGTAAAVGQPFLRFNGLGRLSPVPASDVIFCVGMDELAPSTTIAILPLVISGVNVIKCATSTTERRMQVVVTTGGQIRMCDPNRAITDPAGC